MDCIGLVRDILTDELAVPVATDMPKDRPTRMVMVDLEGDTSDEFILRPRIAITCWGRTDRDAHGLAVSAVQALQDVALDHDYLSAAQLETLSREEWSRTGQSRYLAIVELVINTDE